jgi:DNA-binding transcriptional MerR regulator
MSESSHRPKTVADNLGISPATLRLWSNKFHEVLSPAAQKAQTETGTAAQRRYTDTDLRYFLRAKQLLGQGKTYEETFTILSGEGVPDPETIADAIDTGSATVEGQPSSALALGGQPHVAILAMREALHAKDETIEALRTTINANERHVDDLRSENERLREQLTTFSEAVKSLPKPLSWWDRLLGREAGHGG